VVDGGGAARADDKVFQDSRGAGGSVTIRNFAVSDFGKLYRSCGNCSTRAARSVTVEGVTATAPAASSSASTSTSATPPECRTSRSSAASSQMRRRRHPPPLPRWLSGTPAT